MGLWDRIRTVLRREVKEVKASAQEAADRANAALDERERELNASPEEKLRLEQERAARGDAEFEALRRRIERGD
jgi:hypothetical protein